LSGSQQFTKFLKTDSTHHADSDPGKEGDGGVNPCCGFLIQTNPSRRRLRRQNGPPPEDAGYNKKNCELNPRGESKCGGAGGEPWPTNPGCLPVPCDSHEILQTRSIKCVKDFPPERKNEPTNEYARTMIKPLTWGLHKGWKSPMTLTGKVQTDEEALLCAQRRDKAQRMFRGKKSWNF